MSRGGGAPIRAGLSAQMEAMSFEQVHGGILHLWPKAPCAVLDLGAGTGRDAAALAARGHRVTAVEPVRALRARAGRDDSAGRTRWVDDRSPALAWLRRAAPGRFDLVLASAVWMHLDAADRRLARKVVAALLGPSGSFVVTVRHGPIPTGGQVFAVPDSETIGLTRAAGLRPIHQATICSARRRRGAKKRATIP